LPVTADILTAATDTFSAVSARDGLGGAGPRRVREHARQVRRRLAAARRWNSDRRARIARAESELLTAARRLAADGRERAAAR
jgi:hypothetical protein